MKTYIAVLIVAICLGTSGLAQGVNEFDCADACVSFMFCDGQDIGARCTKNPHNAWLGGIKLTPFRLKSYPAKICDPGVELFSKKWKSPPAQSCRRSLEFSRLRLTCEDNFAYLAEEIHLLNRYEIDIKHFH